MRQYNYKVIAQLRDDLSEQQYQAASSEIQMYQEKFGIIKIDYQTYCKAEGTENGSDFGAVTFFYVALEDMKEIFKKLEYYDLEEKSKRVAV